MAQITPNMQLTVWNNLSDPYDSGQLAENFVKIDLHDHSGAGKGVQIDGTKGIVANSISATALGGNSVGSAELQSDGTNNDNRSVTSDHIKDNAVTTSKINDSAVTTDKIGSGQVTKSRLLTTVNASGTTRPLFVDGTQSSYTTLQAALDATDTGTTTYSPQDGDEIYYKAGTISGGAVIWHLRYNAAQSANYPWEFVGGSPLFSASTSATEYDNSTSNYKISTQSVITLPYALTGGIFDITISAYVTVTNDTNMIPTGSDLAGLRTALNTSVAGAFISYQWTASNGTTVIDSAGGTNQFAGIADFFAYNKIENDITKNRKPATTLALTLRTTKSSNLSASKLAFAQRRQDNAAATDTATFDNRTIQIRPVAIK